VLNIIETRWWRRIYTILVALIAVGFIRVSAPAAEASHVIGWWGGNSGGSAANWHNTAIHSSAVNEDICVISSSTHVTSGNFRLNIRDVLYATNNNGVANPANWDGLASNKVYVNMPLWNGTTSTNPARCNDLTQTQRNAVPVEAYLTHDVTQAQAGFQSASPCSSFAGNSACTDNRTRVWNATAKHYDMLYSYMWFPEVTLYRCTTESNKDVFNCVASSHIWANGNRSYVSNHEFGHVLGLNDGGSSTDTECNTSIMHAGKGGACGTSPSVVWPSASDRTSVTNLANRVDNCVQSSTPTKCP
jgi:hypothetical protein